MHILFFLFFSLQLTETTEYLNWWTQNVSSQKRQAILQYAPITSFWSWYYQIDPLLVDITISCESSWNPGAVGKIKELGLMQLHNKKARACMRNINDPSDQIRCGVKYRKKWIDDCNGSYLQGLNKYRTGKCKPVDKKARYRYKLYK